MKKSIFIIYLLFAVFITACDTFDDPVGAQINDVDINVVNEEGVPVSGVWVKIYSVDYPDFVVDSTYTTVLGKGEFRSVAPGNYKLKAYELSGDELGFKDIVVERDNELNKIVWTLDVYVENYDYSLSLIDNRKNPIVGRKVALYTRESNPTLIKEVKSDSDGLALFPNTVVGDYTVRIYDEENASIFAELEATVSSSVSNKEEFVIRRIFHNTKVVITGFMNDPKGSDSPKKGAVSGDGYIHPGQYEYVQLMAVRDVDFAKEPHSVVFTNSSLISSWAHGVYNPTHKRNYQMNLTSGSVKKGTFFYVGADTRMIASYWKMDGSPQVEESRWWGVDYALEPGANGNGAAKDGGGLLGNGSGVSGLLANTKGYPDGIAVFNTINVDENTVPVDAIFYGTALNFDEKEGPIRLQIPNNDLYSRKHLETDEDQPIFGSGDNTYLFPVPAQDLGVFMRLGGQVTSEEWIIPRKGSPVLFNLKDMPGLSISDIERSTGSTIFVDK